MFIQQKSHTDTVVSNRVHYIPITNIKYLYSAIGMYIVIVTFCLQMLLFNVQNVFHSLTTGLIINSILNINEYMMTPQHNLCFGVLRLLKLLQFSYISAIAIILFYGLFYCKSLFSRNILSLFSCVI